MSQPRQNEESALTPTRRGKILYESNPSVSSSSFRGRVVTKTHKGKSAYMVASDTGEVLGSGSFGFIEETQIDSEKFVKVYLDGIKQYANLSKAGAALFEFLYREISGFSGRDKDTVSLNYYLAQKWKPDLSRRTYERGLAELLEKEFLFRSVASDVYFVNVRYMFNGDRMVVVRAYRRAGSTLQIEMPLESRPKTEKASD